MDSSDHSKRGLQVTMDTKENYKNPNYKGKWKAPLIDNPVVTMH